MLIVPEVRSDILAPSPHALVLPRPLAEAVEDFLDERRLLTCALRVDSPSYVFMSVRLTLFCAADASEDRVRADVEERLYRFIHPVTGGADGRGWRFGQPLRLTDVYAQVGAVPGVAYLTGVTFAQSNVENGEFESEVEVPVNQEELLPPDTVLCSRVHSAIVERLPRLDGGRR